MIGRLEGRLVEKGERLIVLDVGGVGYEVEVPSRAMEEIAEVGETQLLHTHFIVREDAQKLFGFTLKTDRDTFRVLIRTDGVGPAMALSLLSQFTPSQLAEHAHNDNQAAFCQVSGIGKKTATRLCFNLKEKLVAGTLGDGASAQAVATSSGVSEAVIKALVQQLGFKAQEAKLLVQTNVHPDMDFEEALQTALRASANARS